MLDQFQGIGGRLFRADLPALSYDGSIQALTCVSMALFLWAGAHEVMDGRLTIGGLVAFNSLVALANAPIVTLLGTWDELQRAAVLVDRLSDDFEQEPEQGTDRSRVRPVGDLEGDLAPRQLRVRHAQPPTP